VTDLPENVDLQWIGRTLIAHGRELRALRDDFGVMALTLLRIDRNVSALREETQRLWEAHGDLRRRVDVLEKDK
jgi:hypothetical protein